MRDLNKIIVNFENKIKKLLKTLTTKINSNFQTTICAVTQLMLISD